MVTFSDNVGLESSVALVEKEDTVGIPGLACPEEGVGGGSRIDLELRVQKLDCGLDNLDAGGADNFESCGKVEESEVFKLGWAPVVVGNDIGIEDRRRTRWGVWVDRDRDGSTFRVINMVITLNVVVFGSSAGAGSRVGRVRSSGGGKSRGEDDVLGDPDVVGDKKRDHFV